MQYTMKIHKRHISKVSSELKKKPTKSNKQFFIAPFYCQTVISESSFLSEGMPKEKN